MHTQQNSIIVMVVIDVHQQLYQLFILSYLCNHCLPIACKYHLFQTILIFREYTTVCDIYYLLVLQAEGTGRIHSFQCQRELPDSPLRTQNLYIKSTLIENVQMHNYIQYNKHTSILYSAQYLSIFICTFESAAFLKNECVLFQLFEALYVTMDNKNLLQGGFQFSHTLW